MSIRENHHASTTAFAFANAFAASHVSASNPFIHAITSIHERGIPI